MEQDIERENEPRVDRPRAPFHHHPPRRRRLGAIGILLLGASLGVGPAFCATVPDGFRDDPIVQSLSTPTGIAFVPDGRLFVVEQNTARIRLIVNGALSAPDPVIVVPNVNGGGEGGLLGIAVDPQWPAHPYVYTHATVTVGGSNHIRISRFTVAGDVAFAGDGHLTIDPASRFDLIDDIHDDIDRHNGGTLRFGPDGRLYVSLGEDGTACAAQDTSSLRGVILRLDVSRLPSGPGGPPSRALITPPDNPLVSTGGLDGRLIYAWGLRNPFRFHIDRANGALFIGDVGEAHWEEIDRADQGGRNFGWPGLEGPSVYDKSCVGPAPFTAAIFTVDRTGQDGAATVSAGVYRRPTGATGPFPVEYEGSYFFSDFYTGILRRLVGSGSNWGIAPAVAGQPTSTHWAEGLQQVTDYLVGPDGALWYCRQSINFASGTGQIRRIGIDSITPPPPPDTLGSFHVEFGAPYPLPAPGYANLVYDLGRSAQVQLVLYDIRGRVTRHLVEPTVLPSGRYVKVWDGFDDDGRAVKSGVYFARLTVNGTTHHRRVTLIR